MFDDPVFLPNPRWAEITRMFLIVQWAVGFLYEVTMQVAEHWFQTSLRPHVPHGPDINSVIQRMMMGLITSAYFWNPIYLVGFEGVLILVPNPKAVLRWLNKSTDLLLVILLLLLRTTSASSLNAGVSEYKQLEGKKSPSISQLSEPTGFRTIEDDIRMDELQDQISWANYGFLGSMAGLLFICPAVIFFRARKLIRDSEEDEPTAGR